MTFTEIVNAVAGRLNLSDPATLTRIGTEVNDRYRRVTSSIGVSTVRRATDTKNTAVGNPRVTFALNKLEIVYTIVAGKRRVLEQRTYDQWRNSDTWAPATGDSLVYAVESVGALTVTIVLDPVPTSIYALNADGMAPAVTFAGTDVPNFPADFHDVLMHGAIADELYKLEKPDLAKQAEAQYEGRLSDLRLFLAKSAYLEIYQGRTEDTRFRWPLGRRWWR